MNYIAHIREGDGHFQFVEEHLLGVKELAESYGEKIGIKHITGLAGMLHDLGKYTNRFRNYILEAVNHPDSAPKRGSVDHSTAGGKLLYELFHVGQGAHKGMLAEVVGNAIISHHSYLHDFLNPELESNYLNRVRDKDRKLDEFDMSVEQFYQSVMSEMDFQNYVENAAAELKDYLAIESQASSENKLMFLTKYIFSALIDADRTNTRRFEENKMDESLPDMEGIFYTYYDQLMAKIHSFTEYSSAISPINQLRSRMSEQCDKFAEQPSGVYTLSIPTGGGKTLASLRYGLKHAMLYNKKHVIYVVPYTTIIEQNADEIRKILKDDANILEHHSNIIDDSNDDDEFQDGRINVQQKLKLAKDNWDSPIIFTTMVQFLNVFFAKGSRNIRRLHNLSESVIIFDEVQKVPVSCVTLFNQALNFLKTCCHTSIVLCTATQPALDFVEKRLDINKDAEMIGDLNEVIDAFKRVEIIDYATEAPFSNDQICSFVAEKMAEVNSVLVILNTKSVVKKLYQQLTTEMNGVPVYHLSTSMCASHRNQILTQVRTHLCRAEKVICISTQLIEAGVDVSFECVIRSLAGLDSIAQAAGRCNRHGEHELQKVYVIDHAEENLKHLREIRIGKEISRKILIDLQRDQTSHGGNILSDQAMDRYFQRLYTELQSDLDYSIPKLGSGITEWSLLAAGKVENPYFQEYHSKFKKRPELYIANSYRTAAEHFRVIDQHTTSVIVPFGEGKDIIAELSGDSRIEELSKLLKKAQQYTINLFEYELRALSQNDGLVSYLDGKVLVLIESAYNEEFGVDLKNDSQFDLSIY